MNIKSSELFMNMKRLPERGNPDNPNQDYIDLVNWELDKCIGGININGVHLPGWLYWHTNHWHIRIDKKDNYGNIIRVCSLPYLRDNEWIISDAIERARLSQKAVLIAGARQISKSECEASYTSYNATLFKDTQNVIVGGNDPDLALLKDKIDFGIKNEWEGIRIPKLDKDWRKPMVKLGFKGKNNDDEIWSYIVIRNVADGKNTEGPAGITAKSYVADEIAKYMFAQAYEAAKPAFMSEFGWRAVPLMCCTGGNAEKFADAERYFLHPDANNILSYTDNKTGLKTGLFMSGLYRQDCKYDTNLADYLIKEGKLPEGNYDQLSKLSMKVSDKDLALKRITEDRRLKALDPDQSEYRKLIMYYPIDPKECFYSSTDNFYNSHIAQIQKDDLEIKFPGLKIGMFVELEEVQDGNNIKISHKPSKKLPISSFPVKSTEDLDTPIVILEHPMVNPPWGLFTAGVDPYVFDEAPNSDSLGAVYIHKRAYDVLSDSYQDMIVAYYVGRPKNKSDWNNNARLLIEYYNANTLCENDEMSFINYMNSKGKGHFLMDTPDWLVVEMNTKSVNSRPKGISRQSAKVQLLLRTTFKQYMEETFTTVIVEGSNETKKILGVSKINDPMLLEEIIKWNKDGNFDREVAYSLAITCAKKMDEQHISAKLENDDPRFTYNPSIYKTRTPFAGGNTFISNKHSTINKLFK